MVNEGEVDCDILPLAIEKMEIIRKDERRKKTGPQATEYSIQTMLGPHSTGNQ